jgi:hypothetical protein
VGIGDFPLTDARILAVLGGYFALLQRHFGAEAMMEAVLTEDFETGFVGGVVWKGRDGLRDFLSQRAGFFDERHEVQEILARAVRDDGDLEVKTRLRFLLRRWEDPARPARSSRVRRSTPGACAAATMAGASPHRWSMGSRT